MAELKFPQAIPFAQNCRNCWVTKITVEDAITLTLPTPAYQMSMFEIPNRGLDEPHIKAIAKYLENPHWALPALILATDLGVLQKAAKGSLVCDTANLRVLDGQHRIKGMTEQAIRGDSDFIKQELAVVIIEVRNSQEQGQIWMDFAKNKAITGSWRDAVDNTTPFNRIAKLAAEDSTVLKGRTLVGRRTISHNAPELITISGLKQVTSTIALGVHRNATSRNQLAYESEDKQQELRTKVVSFFDKFLPLCQPNYELLNTPEQFGQHVIGHRVGTCAYDTPAINLLANVHARWMKDGKEENRLANFVGKMNMSKAAPENWLSQQQAYDPEKGTYASAQKKKLWREVSTSLTKDAGLS